MRWVVTVIAVAAVLGCIAPSAFMNWLFMTSLGKMVSLLITDSARATRI
jgi:hypothetical protein